jgi:hypothetical protein
MSARTPEELRREAKLWRELALEEIANARGFQRAARSQPDLTRAKFLLASRLAVRSARHANHQALERLRLQREVQAELYRFLGRLAGVRRARCGRELSDVSMFSTEGIQS